MSIFFWAMVVVGALFTASDLHDRDYVGAFLAGGLTITCLAGALAS